MICVDAQLAKDLFDCFAKVSILKPLLIVLCTILSKHLPIKPTGVVADIRYCDNISVEEQLYRW